MQAKTKAIIAIAALFLISAGATAALVYAGLVELPGGKPAAAERDQGSESEDSGKAWEESMREKQKRKLRTADLTGIEGTGATDADVEEMLMVLNNYKKDNPNFGLEVLEVSGGTGGKFKVADTASGETYTMSKTMTSWKFEKDYDLPPGEGGEVGAQDMREALAAERAGRQAAQSGQPSSSTASKGA